MYAALELFFWVIGLGYVLWIVLSIWLARSLARSSSWRVFLGVGLAVAPVVWLGLRFGPREIENSRWRKLSRIANEQCGKELKNIPSTFDIDEFIDERAGIQPELMLDLLARRKVKKIHVKLRLDYGKNLTFGATGASSKWRIMPNTFSDKDADHYVTLSLADRGSGTCFDDKNMPNGFYNGRPPLLPNTCLSVVFSERPQGKHALIHKADMMVNNARIGHWSIVNEETGQQLAALATSALVMSPPGVLRSDVLWRPDCRSPYHILATRIRPANPVPDSLTVTAAIKRTPSPRPEEIISENLITLTHRETPFAFSEQEKKTYFSDDLYWESWNAAVEQASHDGYGDYADKLFDLENLTLVSLDLADKHWKYHVYSSDKGFYVLSSRTWGKGETGLIARYDLNGIFEWAINVQPRQDYCRSYPNKIRSTQSAIALYFICNDRNGYVLEVPKDDIPFFKALRKTDLPK